MERKSAQMAPRDLAIPIVAMANADGGYLIIGIEDDGTVTGIDDYDKNVNELLRVPFDFCVPSVSAENSVLEVTDHSGKHNHILVMHILPSSQVIANQADDVFLRTGDKSKKLNFEQRLQLVYAKGVKYFEDQPVSGARLEDIDLAFVQQYCDRIGYSKGNAEHYLRHNHGFVITRDDAEQISGAAILLFGSDPQAFFPRARVRFIRYEGNSAEVGDRMNVVKDVKFTGRILEQIRAALAFIKTQIREFTKLGEDAVFQTIPEYPEFCWTEMIVNAVAHRDYSIKGTDIQVKMFDDHFTVESPGILPGMVKLSNIREFHFSRNPKIVELLNEYDLVKEFGEGVDRIYKDMASAGLPEPVYRQSDFMLYATLKNKNWGEEKSWLLHTQENAEEDAFQKIVEFCSEPKSRKEIMEFAGITSRAYFYKNLLVPLLDSGKLARTIPDKPKSRMQKYIKNV